MTARFAPMRRSLTDYVDQVVRKEQFLADHPYAYISLDREAPPYQRWRGQLPGRPEVRSHDLGRLLDQLDDLVAAHEAHTRWPNWTFTCQLDGWQAKQTNGPELLVGHTLEQVEKRVAQREEMSRPGSAE
jgi:hypothetical protein